MITEAFIATSLDGFIARENGDLDWLELPEFQLSEEQSGYKKFFESIDCIVMGRNTFDKVLSFGFWPYEGKKVIVLTSKQLENPNNYPVSVINAQVSEVYKELVNQGFKKVYIDGGNTIRQFIEARLLNKITITVMPVLINKGPSLFGNLDKDVMLKCTKVHRFENGIVQMEYEINDD